MFYLPQTTYHSEIIRTTVVDTATFLHEPWRKDRHLWSRTYLTNSCRLSSTFVRYQLCEDQFEPSHQPRLMVYSLEHQTGWVGVMYMNIDPRNDQAIRDYVAILILKRTDPPAPLGLNSIATCSTRKLSDLVSEAFEVYLMFDSHNQHFWKLTGRELFRSKAEYWINLRRPIEFALPAFPCKTTNPEKASSSMPDGAEYEALENLQQFCAIIEEIYEPGCVLTIVSDGHVFSDCQGTDDAIVTLYNEKLQEMLETIEAHNHLQNSRIIFCSLQDLLVPEDSDVRSFLPSVETLPPVNHPVQTQTLPQDNFARSLMIGAFATPPRFFKDLIKFSADHTTTALYRGFSRFMFDDLAYHPDYISTTTSQRKKVAEKVALEMVQRNNTYSRVIEHLFPNHIRLSIHGHNNSGPKFAVRLVPLSTFENADTVVDTAKQHLHVPTPWHNTVVDIITGAGIESKLGKARHIEQAIKQGICKGHYNHHHPRGGRWVAVQDDSD